MMASSPHQATKESPMRISASLLSASLAMLGTAQLAAAATDTDNMAVTASVVDACTISAGALDFGVYDTLVHAAKDGTATLSVQCTTGAAAKLVTLGEGLQPESALPAAPLRQMIRTGFANLLKYKLYSDAGRTTAWGDTGFATAVWASSTIPQEMTVYGTIDANQDVPAGAYTDTVVATITF
jgi:spore coat protein U-like protein